MSTIIIPAPFAIARLPKILFGSGTIDQLSNEILRFGPSALIVTGAKSFVESEAWTHLQPQLQEAGIKLTLMHVQVIGNNSLPMLLNRILTI